MKQAMELANSPVIWVFAALVVVIVIFQAIVFIRIASQAAPAVGMNKKEVGAAVRAGAISALGPSFAIIVVAISLITLIGDPVTLMRIGIVGSAPIETVGASLGSQAVGVDLGSPKFNEIAFTNAVWVMCLGGMGWLLFVALFTKSLDKIQTKVARKGNNVTLLKAVSTAAMIGAFSFLGGSEMIKGVTESIVLIAAFLVMPIIIMLSKKLNASWLREWSLGLVILVGLSVGYLLS
ncbi:DUF5058 family protein [Sporosarcina sp. HYO08]|uniref:DUF5058 family protein n=1 Tax=Sporosarcina sp. HYO08 TaxID=1759557 RepID=UPI00079AE0F1|nr:DUF5058 family protein [Sporosarcina sp. HYO08]KXH80748.1 translation elongation factor EF-1alpha [Sporosarcina sp. HYO08]